MKISEYIGFFEDTTYCGKTQRFRVVTHQGGTLGIVKWFSSWRRYCFYPAAETLYDPDCLYTIGEFCERQTKIHKEKP